MKKRLLTALAANRFHQINRSVEYRIGNTRPRQRVAGVVGRFRAVKIRDDFARAYRDVFTAALNLPTTAATSQPTTPSPQLRRPAPRNGGKNLKNLIAAIALLACSVAPAGGAERILSFDSDTAVHPDGSMTVTETIRVESEQNRIKRGIYRDFPTRYDTPYGTVNVAFDVLRVQRDGQPEPYHTESLSNGERVYIGDKNRILPPDEYEYTIRYRTDRQLGFFEDHDELYWNVTGNGWAFPIDRVRARVTLPGGVAPRASALEAYTGYQGDRGGDYTARVASDGAAVFETTRGLNPNEGLTIVVSWPPGAVQRPTGADEVRYFLRDNAGLLFGAGGLLLVGLYFLLAWLRVGRDPESGVVIPRFEPPVGLSPAATRYIRRMGYDNKAFAAAVINMAVKEFIDIQDDGGDYTLARKPADEAKGKLSRGEQAIIERLFSGGNTIALKKKNHSAVRKAIKAHQLWLRNEYHKIYFKTNGWLLLPGVALSVGVLLAAGFGFTRSPELIFMSIWLTGWTFSVYMLVRQGHKFMAAVFCLFELGTIAGFIGMGSWEFLALLLLLIGLNVLFYYLIKAPTDAGRRLLDEIEGLKMYMEVAEKDRMNLLNPPEQTPQHFEALLPYALALGVDQAWSESFAAHLARHGHEESPYRPAWYRGNRWNDFSTAGFSSSLGSSLSSAISSSSTAPGSSSGSGGGGSSGGGGGGGGGGGW